MGSPNNMGRIAHEPYEGEIKKISIGLTSDLYARRAIKVLGIPMGMVLRASTGGIKAYPLVLREVANKGIEVQIYRIPPSRRSKRRPSKARRPTPWSIPRIGEVEGSNWWISNPRGLRRSRPQEKLGIKVAQT